jgi:hypothetical protein
LRVSWVAFLVVDLRADVRLESSRQDRFGNYSVL